MYISQNHLSLRKPISTPHIDQGKRSILSPFLKLRILPHSQNLRMKIQFSPSHFPKTTLNNGIIDQFGRKRCQKTRKDVSYQLLSDFFQKCVVLLFFMNGGLSKIRSVHIYLLKGFILVVSTVVQNSLIHSQFTLLTKQDLMIQGFSFPLILIIFIKQGYTFKNWVEGLSDGAYYPYWESPKKNLT